MSGQVDIRSMSITAASKLLRVPAKSIHAHVARGLPLRKDGHVDLVVYAAWLNTEDARRTDAAT